MLKQIKINHFKSLSNISLDLQNITVIAGRNGSGKSNLVDAFRFLRDCSVAGIDHAINHRGGPSIVREYSPTRPYNVSFSVKLDDTVKNIVTDKESSVYSNYAFSFSSSSEAISIETETYDWLEVNKFYVEKKTDSVFDTQKMTGNRNKEGHLILKDDGEEYENILDIPYDDDELSLGRRYYARVKPTVEIGGFCADYLKQFTFSSIYPNIMRVPTRLSTEKILREDCSNWGSIIRLMRRKPRTNELLKKIIRLMQSIMPELSNIRINNVGGYLVPQFLVEEERTKKSHYLDPIQLSDGTLRVFGILLSLYQIPHPKFLFIEEPEQTIHPALLGVLVDAINEASMHTQILITTHSPHLLDYFDINSIKVTYLHEGKTRIKNVKKSQIESVKENLMLTSEIMSLDGLKPDLDGDG